MQLGGPQTSVTFTTPGGSSTLPLEGQIGYSFCPEGDSGVSCPFYLGSLELSSVGSVAVTDSCPGGGSLDLDVSDLSIELLQPAMGIADDGSAYKAMPEGALQLMLGVTLGEQHFAVRAVNEHDVLFLSARRDGIDADALAVQFDVPCGAGQLPVTASFDLATSGILERRPSVSIGIASPRSCSSSSSVFLAATASDGDGDLLPVRWEVDGVRVAPGVTSLPFTRPHTFRAIARDARGATTVATKSVTCQ